VQSEEAKQVASVAEAAKSAEVAELEKMLKLKRQELAAIQVAEQAEDERKPAARAVVEEGGAMVREQRPAAAEAGATEDMVSILLCIL
jgi:hypothetical protein